MGDKGLGKELTLGQLFTILSKLKRFALHSGKGS